MAGWCEGAACPDPTKVKFLWMYIDSRTPAEATDTVRYQYQRQVLDAACVTAKDSDAVKLRKIQSMWKQFEDRLVCNSLRFDVANGSVIKFAAISVFDAPTDGRTVLDYLRYKIDQQRQAQGRAGELRICGRHVPPHPGRRPRGS